MYKKVKFVSFLIVSQLLIFSFFRLLNYIWYFDIYGKLSSQDTILAFIDGIRFDASILFTFSGIFFLSILFPFRKRIFYKIFLSAIVLLFNIYIIILGADLVFFEHVKRHIADELLLMKNDIGFFFSYVKGNYVGYALIVILLLFNYYLLKQLFLWINRNLDERNFSFDIKINSSVAAAFLIFSIFIVRGTPTGQPINIIDGFTRGSNQYGNLVLNGVFTSYHSMRAYESSSKNYMPDEKAFSKASEYIVEDYEDVPDSNYPLTRKYKKILRKTPKNYNIAIILLESWSSEFVDSFSGNNYGATPNLDRIYKDSLVFKNFYANGQRSIFGITSTLISIPQIQGLPYLGQGLEISNVFRPASYFNSKGYTTIAMQSSKRRSYRVSSIAKALGFKEFYGMEDIPVTYPYTADEKPNFGWDYDTLDFLFNKLDASQKPFFSFVFTGTTHEKFILPHEKFEKYPHNPHGLNGFLNTLFYSDYSLGHFFERAEKTDWFKNTIFIITADHTHGRFQGESFNDKFKIPLLIYAPHIIKPGESDVLGSQVDIMPTILDIAGFKSSFAGIGKSLLRKSDNRFAVLNSGRLMSLLTKNGKVDFIGKRVVASDFKDSKTTDAVKKLFFAIDQTIYKNIKNNKFYKSE